MMDDLETASLKAQIGYLHKILRQGAGVARQLADTPGLGEEARYQAGYADALNRVVQSLKTLEEQW